MVRFTSLCVMVAALLAVPARIQASPFTAFYTGEVGGEVNGPLLLQAFPVGTPISFTVTFDDEFMSTTDQSIIFGPARPSTGALDIGGVVYQLTAHEIGVVSIDPINDQVIRAIYDFSGAGPAVDGFEFVGLFVNLTPALALHTGNPFGSVEIGWDIDPGPSVIAAGVKSNERTQQFSVEPVEVPAAPLGWMMLTGIGAVVARRARSTGR
jgi:hypothetical protein